MPVFDINGRKQGVCTVFRPTRRKVLAAVQEMAEIQATEYWRRGPMHPDKIMDRVRGIDVYDRDFDIDWPVYRDTTGWVCTRVDGIKVLFIRRKPTAYTAAGCEALWGGTADLLTHRQAQAAVLRSVRKVAEFVMATSKTQAADVAGGVIRSFTRRPPPDSASFAWVKSEPPGAVGVRYDLAAVSALYDKLSEDGKPETAALLKPYLNHFQIEV